MYVCVNSRRHFTFLALEVSVKYRRRMFWVHQIVTLSGHITLTLCIVSALWMRGSAVSHFIALTG